MALQTTSPELQLAHQIKQRRHWQRLSQTELGRRAGVSRQTIAQIEAGRANPSLQLITRISDALDAEVLITLRRQLPTEAI